MNFKNERSVNKRDFLLDHLEERNLDAKEALCLMLIDFFNQHHISISHDHLATKLKLSLEQVDELLSALQEKNYLSFGYDGKSVQFDISGIFEEEVREKPMLFDGSIFDLFEREFGRPITQLEMERMSEWLRIYDSEWIILALREAIVQDKINFNYINKILMNWEKDGKCNKNEIRGMKQ